MDSCIYIPQGNGGPYSEFNLREVGESCIMCMKHFHFCFVTLCSVLFCYTVVFICESSFPKQYYALHSCYKKTQ